MLVLPPLLKLCRVIDGAGMAVGAGIEKQVRRIRSTTARTEPGGPAKLSLPAKTDFRHLVRFQHQIDIPDNDVAGIIANDRHQPVKAEPPRQQSMVIL